MIKIILSFIGISIAFTQSHAYDAITGVYSPVHSPNLFQDNPDYVSIVDSNSLFRNLGFRSQDKLGDKLVEEAGDIDLEFEFFKEGLDIDGEDLILGLQIRPDIERAVFHRNYGEVNNNGEPLSPLKSVYTVVDEASNEIRFQPRISLNPHLKATSYIGVGVKVRRIYDVDNIEDYKQRRSKDSLREIGVNLDDLELKKEKKNKLISGFKDLRELIIDPVENLFSNAAGLFADEDQTKIFLQNLLDPVRLGTDFFRISAEKIKNSPNILPGEVLIHTVYVSYSPLGFRIGNGGFNFDVDPSVKTIMLHAAFKKLENGIVLAKSSLETRKQREMELDYKIDFIGLKPFEVESKRNDVHTTEYGYQFDLKDKKHRKAFDNLFKTKWFTTNFTEMQRKDYVTYTRDTRMPKDEIENSFKLELLFMEAKSKDKKTLLKRESESMLDGGDVTEFIGNITRYNRFAFRPNIPFLREYRENQKTFNTYGMVNSSKGQKDNKVDLVFQYEFADMFANQAEFDKMVKITRMALSLDELRDHSESFNKIDGAITSHIDLKKRKRDAHTMISRLSFKGDVTEQIFQNPNTLDNLKFYVAQILLGKEAKYQDLRNLRRGDDGVHPDDCTNIRNHQNGLILHPGRQTSCFLLRAMGLDLIDTFLEIQNSHSLARRLELFNELIDRKDLKPYLPMLVLKLAVTEKIENGAPLIRDDIEDLLNRDLLGVEFYAKSENGNFESYVDRDDTKAAEPLLLPGEFDVVLGSDRYDRINVKNVYQKQRDLGNPSPEIHIHFTSRVKFDEDYKISGEILDYRFVLKDKLLATFEASEIKAVEMPGIRGLDAGKLYSYIFVIPASSFDYGFKEDFVARFQVVHKERGGFVTEPQEAKFKVR